MGVRQTDSEAAQLQILVSGRLSDYSGVLSLRSIFAVPALVETSISYDYPHPASFVFSRHLCSPARELSMRGCLVFCLLSFY